MYVVFEGVDTCGKSTQIELLKPLFPQAVFTKEPGGSRLGEKIREMILQAENIHSTAEFLLFLADRAQHTQEVLKPNLSRLIISDRSLISGIAYAQNLPQALDLNLFATENILPQKVVFFKTTSEILRQRLDAKEKDSIEWRGVEYFLRIQDRMQQIIAQLKIPKILTLSAEETIPALHAKILAFIRED